MSEQTQIDAMDSRVRKYAQIIQSYEVQVASLSQSLEDTRRGVFELWNRERAELEQIIRQRNWEAEQANDKITALEAALAVFRKEGNA